MKLSDGKTPPAHAKTACAFYTDDCGHSMSPRSIIYHVKAVNVKWDDCSSCGDEISDGKVAWRVTFMSLFKARWISPASQWWRIWRRALQWGDTHTAEPEDKIQLFYRQPIVLNCWQCCLSCPSKVKGQFLTLKDWTKVQSRMRMV